MLNSPTLINIPKHHFKNIKEAKMWAKKNITGTYKNNNTSESINISNTCINKYLSESAIKKSANLDAHLAALLIIPKLVEVSILKETHNDKNEDKNIKEIQRFYGSINYEGKIYLVKITIKVTKIEGNKAYSYEVMNIKNPNNFNNHSGKYYTGRD